MNGRKRLHHNPVSAQFGQDCAYLATLVITHRLDEDGAHVMALRSRLSLRERGLQAEAGHKRVGLANDKYVRQKLFGGLLTSP
jgi:hypothetical protein